MNPFLTNQPMSTVPKPVMPTQPASKPAVRQPGSRMAPSANNVGSLTPPAGTPGQRQPMYGIHLPYMHSFSLARQRATGLRPGSYTPAATTEGIQKAINKLNKTARIGKIWSAVAPHVLPTAFNSLGGMLAAQAVGVDPLVWATLGGLSRGSRFRMNPQKGQLGFKGTKVDVPIRAVDGTITGAFAGGTMDYLAGAAGYDTKHRFTQLGMATGGLAGTARGINRLGDPAGKGKGLLPKGVQTATGVTRNFLDDVVTGSFRPLVAGVNRLSEAAYKQKLIYKIRAVAKAKGWDANKTNAYIKNALQVRAARQAKRTAPNPWTIGQLAGVTAGTGTLGLMGVGAASNAITNKARDEVTRYIGDIQPAIDDYMDHTLDKYEDRLSLPNIIGRTKDKFMERFKPRNSPNHARYLKWEPPDSEMQGTEYGF